MGTRPLRHYYDRDGDTVPALHVEPNFADTLVAWKRHRDRFTATLQELPTDEWDRPTRCAAWSVREVIGHLIVVDGFWAMTFTNARNQAAPTTMLEGFNPSNSTDAMVAATTELEISALLAQFVDGTDALAQVVDGFGTEHWEARCESPIGHLPATCNFGHAFWDSWLHERDIFEPVGAAPAIVADELAAATRFSLLFAALQGGLVDDPMPAGPGPEGAIDVTIAFDDLPDAAIRVQIDRAVRITPASVAGAMPAGRAIDVAEGLTGRRPLTGALDSLPADLGAQLGRAALVL